MTRYLQTLIAQARGAAPDVKPRLRLRFEPEESGRPDLAREGSYEAVQPTSAPLIDKFPVEPLQAAAQSVSEYPDTTPKPERLIVNEIHVQSDRVERIERLITEKEVLRQAPAPERTVLLEVPPRLPAEPGVTAKQDPFARAASQPDLTTPQAAAPRKSNEAAFLEPPLRREEPFVPKPAAHTPTLPEFAAHRRALVDKADPATAPEITITIGVLDIRLTQDAPVDRRTAQRAETRADNTLPLADYLAKRSGTTP